MIHTWAEERDIIINDIQHQRFTKYAEMLAKANKSMALSGHYEVQDILMDLIIGSIDPLWDISVLRGTLFADIGTGGGIPGIPLAILFNDWKGVLFDSNNRKIEFVKSVVDELSLNNVTVHSGRVEEFGRMEDFRERFNLVVSRAFNDVYTVLELGSPLIQRDGHIYIYSNDMIDQLSEQIIDHSVHLGLEKSVNKPGDKNYMLKSGYLFTKVALCEEKYPRRFAVIQRNAKKIKAMRDNHV